MRNVPCLQLFLQYIAVPKCNVRFNIYSLMQEDLIMNFTDLQEKLLLPESIARLEDMYGSGNAAQNSTRYLETAKGYAETFGNEPFYLFSSPGRTEIGGNHTDHNHGKIVAGSVQMDCIAAAAANNSNQVHLISSTYNQNLLIDLSDLEPSEPHTGTKSLLKGILKGLIHYGYTVHGFNAYLTSNVPDGAGVSSSASFEMLICTIVDYLFNGYSCDRITQAKIGQFAENHYWNKGSGLLDQLACAVGGMITIDFSNTDAPQLRKLDCHFRDLDLDLVLVNTGKTHADLSAEYSSIPNEMKLVADFFGKSVLADVKEEDVIANAAEIRHMCGDRSFLRSLHFFAENRRVEKEVMALEQKDKTAFLNEVTASGNSSWKWLQNCYINTTPNEQSISCALALAEHYLENIPDSACRVHGGGFAGVIAAFVPKKETAGFCEYMDHVLGKPSTCVMYIRNQGAIHMDF